MRLRSYSRGLCNRKTYANAIEAHKASHGLSATAELLVKDIFMPSFHCTWHTVVQLDVKITFKLVCRMPFMPFVTGLFQLKHWMIIVRSNHLPLTQSDCWFTRKIIKTRTAQMLSLPVHRNAAIFPKFWPCLAPVIILWWPHKGFKSYHVNKQTKSATYGIMDTTENNPPLYAVAAQLVTRSPEVW